MFLNAPFDLEISVVFKIPNVFGKRGAICLFVKGRIMVVIARLPAQLFQCMFLHHRMMVE